MKERKMNISRRGYIEIYERNERQKERLERINARINILKEQRNIKDTVLNGQTSKLKKVYRRIVYRILAPFLEQQKVQFDNAIDTLELLYGMAEDSIAETTSIIDWAQFDTKEVERYYAMEQKRSCINKAEWKVIQVVSSLNFGDAVGNDVIAIQRALEEAGITTAIYTNFIHKKLPLDSAFYLDELPELNENDILIFHFANADTFCEKIKKIKCRKIIRYHNITPPYFFATYDLTSYNATNLGIKQIAAMKDSFDYGMVPSEFNRQDLIQMGYTCPIEVVPILIPFTDYEQVPDENVIKQYQDNWTNLVFVGRIAPNKKIEDIIACYREYKKINPKSRLILVGNYSETDLYYRKLYELIEQDYIDDVIFTGHISFAAILAYYKVASLFLCMSEHEGFCVPLIEAMYFHVPIIAYSCTAIPYTMGDAGILLQSKEPSYVAEKINELISSKELQNRCIQNGIRMLENYQYDIIKKQILDCIRKNNDKEKSDNILNIGR